MNSHLANLEQAGTWPKVFGPGAWPVDVSHAPTVLFAASTTEHANAALLKAAEFARLLDAKLYVLRVVPEENGLQRFFHHLASPDHNSNLCRTWDALADTSRWCQQVLGEAVPETQLLARAGDFVAEVMRAAVQFNAGFVIVPPWRTLGSGGESKVVQLAHGTGVPVLSAQFPRLNNIVVAATDLADSRYPVINHAHRIRDILNAHFVLVHNVPPTLLAGGMEGIGHCPVPYEDPQVTSARKQLQQVAGAAEGPIETVVTSKLNTPLAILTVARQYDADLLVIGSRPRGRFQRNAGSVAARIVSQSLRSVLIMPLPNPVPVAAAPPQ